jgi:aconitate hydratase
MSAASKNSFSSLATLRVGSDSFEIYRLDALAKAGVGNVARLPFSLKVLLENLLRHEDGRFVQSGDIPALAGWDPRMPWRKKCRSCRPAFCCRISRACPRW